MKKIFLLAFIIFGLLVNVRQVRADCAGELLSVNDQGHGLCINKQSHIFEYGRELTMCGGASKVVTGYCSSSCDDGVCDFSDYSCNYCGACSSEKWCGQFGGAVNMTPAESGQANVWVRVLEKTTDGTTAWKGDDGVDPTTWLDGGTEASASAFGGNRVDAKMNLEADAYVEPRNSEGAVIEGLSAREYWMSGQTDELWRAQNDQLATIISKMANKDDLTWMDLGNNKYWTLFYAARVKRSDNESQQIKFTPPTGKICKGVRWFGGDGIERQIDKGKMEFAVDTDGNCVLKNFNYDAMGNLIVFEIGSAEEAPILEAASSCSSDGSEMSLVVTPSGSIANFYMMANKGGADDTWVPGNRVDGPEDFMTNYESGDNQLQVIKVKVYPDTDYEFNVMPCAAGEQFPCNGKILSFVASCPVTDKPQWEIAAQAMCIDRKANIATKPAYYLGSATKYTLSEDELIQASQSANVRLHQLEIKGSSDREYSLKFEDESKLNVLKPAWATGTKDVSSVLVSGDEFRWTASSLPSGKYIMNYEAPKNWCVVTKIWDIVPVINCGSGMNLYGKAEVDYQLENSLQKTSRIYSSCPRYQVVKSREAGLAISASLELVNTEVNLLPMVVSKCESLSNCNSRIESRNYAKVGDEIRIDNGLESGVYRVEFTVPDEQKAKVCGPQITLPGSQCRPIYAYPQEIESEPQ